MPVVVLDPDLAAKVLADADRAVNPRPQEVWDGVTFIMPDPNLEHQGIALFFYGVFWTIFGGNSDYRVFPGVNVSDRTEGWTENYRSPDLAVYRAENPAMPYENHWHGGPDLALEIVSPDDHSRDKLDFYARVGTREVLILDRDPWRFELYHLRRGRMRLRGTVRPGDGEALASGVIPLAFQLVRGRPRPKVKIVHTGTGQEWVG